MLALPCRGSQRPHAHPPALLCFAALELHRRGRGFRDRAPQDPSSRPFWRVHRVSRQLLVACARGGARWTRGARRLGPARRGAADNGRFGPAENFLKSWDEGLRRAVGGRSQPAGLGEAEITRLLSLRPGAAQRRPRFPPEAQVRLCAAPKVAPALGPSCRRSCPTQSRPPEGRGKGRSRHAGRDRRGRLGWETGAEPGAAPGRGPR